MLMFACAIYSFGYFLELNCQSFNTLIIMRNFEFLGTLFIPTFGILFIAQLTEIKISKKVVILLFSISTILWLLFITNPIHNFVYSSLHLEIIQGFAIALTVKGPAYSFILGYYAFLLIYSSIMLSNAYKISKNKRDKNSYRFMFVIFQIPWFTMLFILSGADTYIDPTPITIMIVCGLFMINETKNDMFQLLISRWKNNYSDINDLALLVDEDEGRIVCSNIAAKSLFDKLEIKASDIITDMDNSKLGNMPISFAIQDEVRWFVVQKNIFDINSQYRTYQLIDVTEQKLIEKGILKSEENYRFLIENNHDIIYELSSEGIFKFVSSSWTTLLGHPKNDVVGKSFRSFVHPDDFEKCMQWLNKVVETGQRQYGIEYRVKHIDGSWFWHTSSAVPLSDFEGKIIGYVGTARDITDRKQAEEALMLGTMLLKAQAETSIDGILALDGEGHVILSNRRFSEIWKIPPAVIDAKNYDRIMKHVLAQLKNAEEFAGKVNYLNEHVEVKSREEVELADGRYLDRYSSPLICADGKYYGRIWYFRDISDSKKQELELIKSKEKQTAIFDQSPIAIEYYDLNGCLENTNDACLRLFGVTNYDEICGFNLFDDPNIFDDVKQKILNGENVKFEKRFDFEEVRRLNLYKTTKSGTIDVEISINSMRNNQKIVGYIVQIQDMTEQNLAREKIENLSFRDQLTGLYNRRYYEQEIVRLDDERYYPLTLIMADVNGLKLTNDAFGHKAGDFLLQRISNILKNVCRDKDIVARIGGDEFVLLLPETDGKSASLIINRINTAIKNEKTDNIILSISMGYAVKKEASESIDEIFMKAEDEMYRHKLSESSSMRSKTIELIMNTLFEKNSREKFHSERVGEISKAIAEKMSFTKDEVAEIKIAGLMHDIGKIGIGEVILNKPDKLNTNEWDEIKRHSEIGYRILGSANEFSQMANYVLEHHEKWDGTGYPKGHKGNEISLQSRIIAVADAYDAMTQDRTYKKALSEEDAISEIKKYSGTQFDPEVVRVFVEKVLKKE